MPSMTSDDKRNEIPEADRDWFGGRRWTGIIAIAVVILVGLCVILLFALHRDGSKGTTAPPPSHGSTMPSKASAAALPTTVPTNAPTGTTWSLYETVAFPSIAGAGPSHVDGAIATGYAHTPLGALLAVVNEGVRYQLAPDSQWKTAAASMLDRSAPGYAAWLKVRAANPYGPGGAAAGNDLGQLAGFQFVSYTPTDAVIQLATRQSDGSLTADTEHVRWLAGDWKFVPGPDGGSAANTQNIDSLAGFAEWKGA